jgi:hypothetical protein
VSHPEVSDGPGDQTREDVGTQGLQDLYGGDGGEDGGPVPAPGAGRQPTGDQAVDEVLGRLDNVADEPLDTQIQVSEQVHRVLQSRLADLGK